MTKNDFAEAAKIIVNNRLGKKRLNFLPQNIRPQNLDEAYTVQEKINQILIENGHGKPSGYKIGCTTPVMLKYMNIQEPSYGEVFDNTVYEETAVLKYSDYQEPGVEAEIAVELGQDLSLNDAPFNLNSVRHAVQSCMASIELVDARYFNYRELDTPTMVADNFFNAACVLGKPLREWQDVDLANVDGEMTVNGASVGTGKGSLIMGHPLQALAWLANKLADRGRELKEGEFVTLGSVIATNWVSQGDLVEVNMSGLGSATIKFE